MKKKKKIDSDAKKKMKNLIYKILFFDNKRFRNYLSTDSGYIFRCYKYLLDKLKYDNELSFECYKKSFNGLIDVEDFFEKNKKYGDYCLSVLKKYYKRVKLLIIKAHSVHNFCLLDTYLYQNDRHLCFYCCQNSDFPDKSLKSNLEKSITSNTNIPDDVANIISSYCIFPTKKFKKPYKKCIIKISYEGDYKRFYCHKKELYYEIKSNNYEPYNMSLDSITPRWIRFEII